MRGSYRSSIIQFLFVVLFAVFFSDSLYAQNRIVTLPEGEQIILYPNKTWDYYKGISYDFDFSTLTNNNIPKFLRSGISVDKQTLRIAVEMYLQGWRYIMPRPKSSQAYWGNSDGRTTWWKGYWYNSKTYKYSRIRPVKQSSGYYKGDEQNDKGYWSNGGSPAYPSKIDWLLSSSGGVKPY
ncbi:hypothetical protein [Marinifilum fragile]|uniref:hypothetical protein n=1 Tax=Marinifilum fragile TaxID=570161 RepID=UPI002AA8C5DB|nr:hypothetical protein [Marinifilum fragile]